jgi:hypothetical protein
VRLGEVVAGLRAEGHDIPDRELARTSPGRLGWQKAVGYGRRSLGETAIFRYKAIIGRGLRARTLPAQKTEARVACSVLNRMARLGMPMSQRIA